MKKRLRWLEDPAARRAREEAQAEEELAAEAPFDDRGFEVWDERGRLVDSFELARRLRRGGII